MKYLLILLILFSGSIQSKELEKNPNIKLAHVLSTMTVLYESKTFPMVQVIQSWEEISECGGPYESCPNARLFITSTMGDLGEPPLLYELPKSKGWKIISTEHKEKGLHIILNTTLNHANVSAESRAKWKSKMYVVRISSDTGMADLVK